MAIKRMVVVINPKDLDDISEALLKIGVKAEDIYLSTTKDITTLEKMGVNINLPAGQVYVRKTDVTNTSEKDYPIIIIY